MSKSKPIQTHYNGYYFRSRVEARWAVFFDTLGVRYEYEPEGYEIDGIKYLPDFYLPLERLWVEVKKDHDLSDREWDKIWSFANSLTDTDQNILVTNGSPWYDAKHLVLFCDTRTYNERYICECPDCKEHGDQWHIATLTTHNDGTVPDSVYEEIVRRMTRTERLMEAYNAARSARFA